jgi:hypothetical protein
MGAKNSALFLGLVQNCWIAQAIQALGVQMHDITPKVL